MTATPTRTPPRAAGGGRTSSALAPWLFLAPGMLMFLIYVI